MLFRSGGPAYLRALGGPYPMVRFVPTGGIGSDALADYLALPNVVAAGGTWMMPANLVKSGDWAGVTKLAQQAAS